MKRIHELMRLVPVFLIVLVFPQMADAQIGLAPDPSFGMNGFQRSASRGVQSPQVGVDSSGRIFISDTFGTAGLRANGEPLSTFGGSDGTVYLPKRIGNPYAASDLVVNQRGLFSSFTTKNWKGLGYAVMLQNYDGTRAASFGRGGLITVPARRMRSETATAVSVTAGGKLLVAGGVKTSRPAVRYARVTKFLASGQIDRSFGERGHFKVPLARNSKSSRAEFTDVVALKTGGCLVAGFVGNRFVVFKLQADGGLEKSFGGGGGAVSLKSRGLNIPTFAGTKGLDGEMVRSSTGGLIAIVPVKNRARPWRMVRLSPRGHLTGKGPGLPARLALPSGRLASFEPSSALAGKSGRFLVFGSAETLDSSGLEHSDPVVMLLNGRGRTVSSFGTNGVSILDKSPMWNITDAARSPGFGMTLVGVQDEPWASDPRVEVARFQAGA